MKAIVDFLRRFVDRYDEKNGLRKKELYMCKSWDTRNRNKLPEWQTKEGEPLCPIFKDDRCCGSCELALTCDHAVDCNCYGYTFSALGGTYESVYMRKSSPYYKYGRMKNDGSFDWDYFYINKQREAFVLGKYLMISDFDKLKVPENTLKVIKEKNFKIGEITGRMDEDGFIELNFSKENNNNDFFITVFYKGVDSFPYESHERASVFCY